MTPDRRLGWLPVCLGLLLAPAAWALNTQLAEILVYPDCYGPHRYLAVTSVAGLVAAVLAAALSWWSAGAAAMSERWSTRAFVGGVSAAAAVVFGFALALQVIATLVLSGCER